MRAVLIDAPLSAKVVEWPVPELEPNQVLVRVRLSGICASDVMAYRGEHSYRVPPVVTGHEIVGEVCDKGAGVEKFAVGDRVVVEPHWGCGQCLYCGEGDYNLCVEKGIIGTQSWPGGFAQFVAVPQECLVSLPDELSWEKSVLIEPLAVGVHAVNRVPITKESKVAVLGAGPIGLVTVLALKHLEPRLILATDIRPEKLELAQKLGADLVANPLTDDLEKLVADKVGAGFDVIFVAVPNDAVLESSFKFTRRKGCVVLIASFGKRSNIHLGELQLYERTLTGTGMYTKQDFNTAVEIATKSTELEQLLSKVIELDEVPEMLRRLNANEEKDSVKIAIGFEW